MSTIAAPEGEPPSSRPSFTFFEAWSINFAIVVYSECMHVEGRLAFSQLWGLRRDNMAKKAKKAKKTKKAKKKKK